LLPEPLKLIPVLPHIAGESISEYLSQKFPYKEGTIEELTEENGKKVAFINLNSKYSNKDVPKNSRVLIYKEKEDICENTNGNENRAENSLILKAALKNIQGSSNIPYFFAWIDDYDLKALMPKVKLFEQTDMQSLNRQICKGCNAITE